MDAKQLQIDKIRRLLEQGADMEVLEHEYQRLADYHVDKRTVCICGHNIDMHSHWLGLPETCCDRPGCSCSAFRSRVTPAPSAEATPTEYMRRRLHRAEMDAIEAGALDD